MEKGLVSIITPMFNAGKYVGETIESVLKQTYAKWEMIVVNDGSQDIGPDVVSEYVRRDSRITCITQKNAGSACARNNGIRAAKGQYIALLDADDTWKPAFLEKQLSLMGGKSACLVYASHTRIDENGNECLQPYIVPDNITYKDLLKSNYISCLTGLYDTSSHGKMYLPEELCSLGDDYAYWLKILKKAEVAYGNKEILANYRILKASASRRKIKMAIAHFKVLHNIEKLGLLRSLYYLGHWAVIGYKKYRRNKAFYTLDKTSIV